MKLESLLRLGGIACVAGGIARIGTALVPADPGNRALEAAYELIDLLLLLGLFAIYARWRSVVGRLGFVALVAGVAALSFIGGPDADPFGFSTYQVGASILGSSVAALGGCMLAGRGGARLASVLWIASWVVGLLSFVPGSPRWLFGVAGALFGAGFVVVGLVLLGTRATIARA